jgi:uncharacterized membrane protein YjgN (DUF898 family)
MSEKTRPVDPASLGEGDMDDDARSAFTFGGNWRDYAPIAFTNLLLTIVTLGFYRFWATTRTRHYLWSRTTFIDEPLEWTGTGKELFIGFLLVLLLLGPPLLVLQFGVQALVIRGHGILASIAGLLATVALLYLGGLARYRALRYRLSRTFWHGIRGGSDNGGLGYALSYLWKTALGSLTLGLLIPWSMVSLWNERWNQLGYGPHDFAAQATTRGLYKRFMFFYLLPFVLFGAVVVGVIAFMVSGMGNPFERGAQSQPGPGPVLAVVGLLLAFYLGLGLVALAYFAKFFRQAIGALSLGPLDFHFTARTKDWLWLILGDIALVIATLGIGAIFLSYRHWKFLVTHLEATGEISLSELTQSTTREPGQGEGLLDAFDIGAF